MNAKDYQESRARIQSMGYQVDIILSPALSFLWDLGGPARSPQWLGLAADLRTVVPQRAGQGNAKQGKAAQDKARQGTARHGTAPQSTARQSKAKQSTSTSTQAQSRFHGASHSNFQVRMERPTHTAYITQPVTCC